MATLFKRKSTGSWWIAYFDHKGRRRYVSSRTTDKATAKQGAAELAKKVARHRLGIVNADDERLAAHGRTPLHDHASDYLRHLELRERSRRHVLDVRRIVGKLEDLLGVARLGEVTSGTIERYLETLKARGCGSRTLNLHQVLIGGFLAWCVRTGRLAANPCRTLPKQDEQRDRRYVRRPLTDDEIDGLLKVADGRGGTRRAFYLCALYLGLRRSELKRLRWSALDLDAGTCTISDGKAHRTDVLPIVAELLDELRRIRPALAHPATKVFDPAPKDAERRRDFEEAKLVPSLVNAKGERLKRDTSLPVVDLHSLRSSLAVRLAKQNVPPMVAQRLMRHASVTTTTRHYVKLQLVDLAAAAATAARREPARNEAQAATGTDGSSPRPLCDPKRANTGANTQHTKRRQDRAKLRDNEAKVLDVTHARNSARRADLRESSRVAAMEAAPGIEPGNNGFAIRRLTAWLRRRASCFFSCFFSCSFGRAKGRRS